MRLDVFVDRDSICAIPDDIVVIPAEASTTETCLPLVQRLAIHEVIELVVKVPIDGARALVRLRAPLVREKRWLAGIELYGQVFVNTKLHVIEEDPSISEDWN